ncbi:hypothetical protein PtB15_17B21 [Puccinia triticina]|nr:hypothetical protein PtB15_17B21 [Puccinia triticina]
MAKRKKRGSKLTQIADSSGEQAEYQQHWHQGDLVVQGFRRLHSKYSLRPNESPAESLQESLSSLSLDNEAEFKPVLLDQLQFHLLPLLLRQITSLAQSLNRFSLINDPGPTLQLILEIQAELEPTIDHIQSNITTIFPGSISSPHRADDNHLGVFKSYRLGYLKCLFNQSGLLFNLRIISLRGYELIQEIKLSSEKPEDKSGDDPPPPDELGNYLQRTLHLINSAIMYVKGSELDIAQEFWRLQLRPMQSVIEEMAAMANPQSNSTNDGQRPMMMGKQLDHEPAIHLARLLIPIIKLCKIFFVKISKRGMNSKRLPVFTKMSSEQIQSLADSMGDINS